MQRRGPTQKLARLTPAELGFKVTVCIAIVCDNRKRIVAVSDMKITFGGLHSADEVAQRSSPIAPNWSVLHSGDIVEATDIIEGAKSQLTSVPKPTAAEAAEALSQFLRDKAQPAG